MGIFLDSVDIGLREDAPAVTVARNLTHLFLQEPPLQRYRRYSDLPSCFSGRVLMSVHVKPVATRINPYQSISYTHLMRRQGLSFEGEILWPPVGEFCWARPFELRFKNSTQCSAAPIARRASLRRPERSQGPHSCQFRCLDAPAAGSRRR